MQIAQHHIRTAGSLIVRYIKLIMELHFLSLFQLSAIRALLQRWQWI